MVETKRLAALAILLVVSATGRAEPPNPTAQDNAESIARDNAEYVCYAGFIKLRGAALQAHPHGICVPFVEPHPAK